MDFVRLLGQQIVELRKFRNMDQVTLASQANISLSHLNDIESGKQAPSFKMLKQLAECLGVTVGELFLFEHQPNAKIYDPIAAPLIEYIKRRGLDGAQIYELIKAAKAMYGD